jgi:prepilin-type N-terminal cleavage/methylation domain-containing protein
MKRSDGGFTIVELLVTIVILGLSVVAVSSTFMVIQNLQKRTYYVDAATRAAQREIETLRNSNYGSLTPGQTIDFTSDLPAGLPPDSSGTVAVTQPVADLRRVDVTVQYKSEGEQKSVTLSSLIGVIGITQ